MTNVWGRRGISTLLLMQYLLIVVGHGAEGHSLDFSFKTPQLFSLSVSHSAHAKSARRILFRIFITPPGFSARPPGSREVKIKPYILHPLCKKKVRGHNLRTISLMILPSLARWQLRWLLHWKSPFPERDHHITYQWDHSQAEPSLATRFIFAFQHLDVDDYRK